MEHSDIQLVTRGDSPNYYANIKIGEKWRKISTKSRDKQSAFNYAYRYYIEEKTKLSLGIRDDKITLGQLFTHYKKKDHSATASVYQKWIMPQWGKTPIASIQQTQLQDWLDNIDRSGARKSDIARVLRGLFELAKQRDAISKIPIIKVETDPDNPRPSFSPEEIKILLTKLDEWAEGGHKRIAKDRRQILKYQIKLILGTGLRPGKEVDWLKWNDFSIWSVKDGKARYKLRVRPETNKTRRGREVIVNADTAYDIDLKWRLIQTNWGVFEPNGYIFRDSKGTRAAHMFQAWDWFIKWADMEFNDLGEKRTLYSLRHFAITQWLINGVPLHFIARQCGHKNTTMIERWYSKVVPVDIADYFG